MPDEDERKIAVLVPGDLRQRVEVFDDVIEVRDERPFSRRPAMSDVILCVDDSSTLTQGLGDMAVSTPVFGVSMLDHHDPGNGTIRRPPVIEDVTFAACKRAGCFDHQDLAVACR
jgi:hypothetical protein